MKKEKACFACKMKKKVKLFPICLHMREFFCKFAAVFFVRMNACESARTRDAKDACKTSKKIAPRRAAKRGMKE